MKQFLLGCLVALAATGCESVNVHVNCQTTPDAVECTVHQTAGKAEVEACWDFTVTCGNGAKVTAPRTCQKVKDGGTEIVKIPLEKLSGVDKCAGDAPKAELSNLTIDGKASS